MPYDLHCEWALHGLQSLAPHVDAVIVVDVLSFSTAVDIVVARGASVIPYPWRDDSAAEFAAARGALLASHVRVRDAYTLSPRSLLGIPAGATLVLPSPNGSALCAAAPDTPLYTACLRNAPAVAAHVARSARRIAVIPAGERWPDNSLRPCLEDLLGAGAVLSALPGSRSPEADLAVAAFERFRRDLPAALADCRELHARGFPEDVELAAAYGVSSAAPILQRDRFVSASAAASR